MHWKMPSAFGGAILAGVVLGGVAVLYSKAPTSKTNQLAGTSNAAETALDPDAQKRQQVALAEIREGESNTARVADLLLTGSYYAHAEWMAALEDDATCGVTPDGRYYIIKNAIGQTRYDELIHDQKQQAAFSQTWGKLGCQQTSPLNQRKLLEKIAEEKEFEETHVIDPDCLKREFAELAKDGAAAARRQSANPHECYETMEELDAKILAQRAAASAPPPPASNAGSPTDPVPESDPSNNANTVPPPYQTPQQ